MSTAGATSAAGATRSPASGRGTERQRRTAGAVDLAVVAALVALSWVLRAGPLGPSSLWLDDAWVAVVHRVDTLGEVRLVGFTSPGFALLLRFVLRAVGPSELAAQALPFAAGVAAAPLAYLVALRVPVRRAAAIAGALVLATSPIAIDYATRVKQYTVEAVLALLLVWAGLRLLRRPGDPRRWAVAMGLGAVATVVSAFAAPYVAAVALAGLLAAAGARRDPAQGTRPDRVAATRPDPAAGARPDLAAATRPGRSALRVGAAASAAYGLAAITWYLAVLRPAVTAAVGSFWADAYLAVGEGPRAWGVSLARALGEVAAGLSGLPAWLVALALAVSAVAVLTRRPVVGVLLLAPAVVAVALAWAQLAPLGGGRTDLYLYPSLTLLLAVAVHEAADAIARVWSTARAELVAAVLAVAVAVAALAVVRPPTPYPRYDVRPLAASVDQRAAPDDVILVYPATMWAYALYTRDAVDIEVEPSSSWGFAPRFARDRTVVLPPGRDDPSAYAPAVRALAAGDADVVWLLASHWREDLDDLRDQLAAAGFGAERPQATDGARLERWVRASPAPG